MSEHFIKNIEIKNFKCFKDFKASGFKRVNLIGGKNNVGKTAFMEACYINVYSQDIEAMTYAISSITYMRNNLEFLGKKYYYDDVKLFLEKFNEGFIHSKLNKLEFEIYTKDGIQEYRFTIGNNAKMISINVNNLSFKTRLIDNIVFIDSFGFTNANLKQVFESVQKKDKEDLLYKYINEFDESIINFKIIGGDKPPCKIQNGEYRDINEFGDGLKHYISIICSLYACENGYLFIDEIDNGIHYTQLDKLWEIILTISKEQNVQVFATTHSKECIESYARVSKKLEDEDISFIKMSKLEDGSLYAGVRDYEMLQYTMEDGHEVRG